MELFHKKYKSPLGEMHLFATEEALVEICYEQARATCSQLKYKVTSKKSPILEQAIQELEEYFKGMRRIFTVPVKPVGGTTFQQSVWKELSRIPYGKTISYQEQASNINKPKAVRAVGAANGRNPVAIIIPCHRVIGKSGDLTGYAGGLSKKKRLLQIEGIL